jgi:hypothetical protein
MYDVKKRNGDICLFDLNKIKTAIKKTFESCNRNYQDSIIDMLSIKAVADAETKIKESILSVEDIQDSVEKILMSAGYEDVAKAYIIYRKQHEKNRNAKQTLINYKKIVEDYTNANDWRVKENASIDYSLGGLILGNSGAITANYWLSEIYDEEIANAHRNCDIHLHDLSMLSGYCFTGNTKVLVVKREFEKEFENNEVLLCDIEYNKKLEKVTFEELYESGRTSPYIVSYNGNEDEFIIVKSDNLRITRYTNEIASITYETPYGISTTESTLDHPFMKVDFDKNNECAKKYVKAVNLNVGDYLLGIKNEDTIYEYCPQIVKISFDKLAKDIPVYDLEVPEYHCFIVDGLILVHNCAGWSLKTLIKEGFGGVPKKNSSKPAKHLSVICSQMVNFLGCFTDDTRIILSDGTKPTIKEMIESGIHEWMIKTYDQKTNKIIDSKMDNLHKTRTVDEYMKLEFDDDDIVKCTLDHKFYTYNRGWVEARCLTEDDDVVNIKIRKHIVCKVVRKSIINETKDVYCGTVHNDFHGFFVNDGKLVHNCLQNEWAG